jgi:predicted DCC family thiol-disulfide oxidoreductase YuxK
MEKLPKDKKIILFDGVCNLCDSAVQFIIKHDKKDIFRFISLQSDLGKEITNYLGINRTNLDSIILYQPGYAYYHKSQAVFKIAKDLGGIYSLSTIFSFLPSSLTDNLYDYIARNRYNWYGKKESCMLPTNDLKAKFLE